MLSRMTILAAVSAVLVPTGGSLTQTSYPLVCQGGGSMNATVFSSGTIFLNFTPGTAPAAAAVGECTWIDRGFRPGEPGVLSFTGDLAGVRYLVDGMLRGGNFYAHVYNSGAGAMVVTGIGP